ncbi:R3H protein [Venustampulla echinocandica]|uniref:R3H protein n=1 Tax=Venustampulla echinocandica TaxID=2656787 RepID=A0A370TQS9_9HELO|nr:R3H protein [Venustampulla echinocandica]RDL37880.1 R3H protein [Venustampulla echinocandica]
MATAQMSADTSRLSFAKVAASAGKDNVALSSFNKAAGSVPARALKTENILMQAHKEQELHESPQAAESSLDNNQSVQEEGGPKVMTHPQPASACEANLVDAVKALNIDGDRSMPMPSLVVNGSGTGAINARKKPDPADTFAEDPFQRPDSGSELGTKPPSLDGKSITSGTTFALDEKESLRPDDSASVKAAEDDDTFSGRGSIVAGSRIGSEAAARAYRAQFYESPDRRMQPMPERQSHGVNTPQSGSSGPQVTDDGKPNKTLIGQPGVPDAFNLFYRQTPDEKLLEALESPKDRIFLLRLEQDLQKFVIDSKEPFIDLPPCNSFCRMLTHKLADYYHMTHQVDSVAGAVRIFRTPFCRLPPSLTSISNPPTSGNTPPPTMPAMKIMRRGGDNDTGPSTSKATSETGSDGKEKSLSAKEKLSREEREAAYNRARERIFGKDEKAGDATPDTEDGNEMSRSSSISTKDRSSQSKRSKPVKRRDDSENFDVRSQYTPFFPQTQVPTWTPTSHYSPMPPQTFNGTGQNMYHTSVPPQFNGPPQQFNPTAVSNGNMQVYNNIPQQYAQPGQPRFQPHSAPITAYGSPVQPAPVAPQQWQQQQQPLYQSPYQPRGPMATGPPNSIPYAFGQLPSTANPADPKSQHPIPGSFNRHAFNPKTQSFVPGNAGLPIPQTMPHHGSPLHGSPHLTYDTYTAPQQQFGSGMGYSMARQGSNNSLPSYHASPHIAHRPMMHQSMQQGMAHGMPQGIPQGLPQGLPQGVPQGMQGLPQNGQVGHHLPNYGNSSTLPPKPPTGV